MIAPNTLLQNRYLVLNQIGQGGMGAVYIATDQRFGSTVALKETFFTDPALRKAFEREARLLNHLRHPALPRVSDHFAEEEGQFLVMEFIADDDLAEKLKERGGAFPLSEVLNWADQLLDALDYLHTQEPPVIHRDIKPQNLKLTPRNAIVLLDFGLAKGTPLQTKVTATGSVFGYSRHYAPLEQIQGSGTDPRSDIYSLGATLYHLMTGQPPQDAITRATLVLNGQEDPLRPANEVHAQVTREVAEVINKALKLNANERPQTASAMRSALREAARQGHSLAQEIAALPASAAAASSANVYEQETQLIYAAPSAETATPDAANKTGTIKTDGATATDKATAENKTKATDPADNETSVAAKLGATATNVEAGESVVTRAASTKTESAKPATTTPQKMPRRRVIAIAASAAVLVALAAVVYTFTRGTATQTPTNNENNSSAPALSPINNANNQSSAIPVESPAETDNAATPETTPTKVIIIKHPPSTENNGSNTAPKPSPKNEQAQNNGTPERPVPPDTNEMTPPRKGARKNFPPPGTPGFDEAIREEVKRKQEEAQQRREAQEQKRNLFLQRMIERARRRKQG